MCKDEHYYRDYANRCKVIIYILQDVERACEREGTIEQFHQEKVAIFEALETDSLTMSDLVEYRRSQGWRSELGGLGLLGAG